MTNLVLNKQFISNLYIAGLNLSIELIHFIKFMEIYFMVLFTQLRRYQIPEWYQQTSKNRVLRICLQRNRYTSTLLLHQLCNISKLENRRIMHLNLYIFKQKGNVNIVNTRNVRTRAHDALLYTINKPNNENNKRNVYNKGALSWNSLAVFERSIEKYETFKSTKKKKNWIYLDLKIKSTLDFCVIISTKIYNVPH